MSIVTYIKLQNTLCSYYFLQDICICALNMGRTRPAERGRLNRTSIPEIGVMRVQPASVLVVNDKI